MSWLCVLLLAAAGAASCATAVGSGLRGKIDPQRRGRLRAAGAVAGGLAGLCATLAAHRAGSWWWLAPLAVWSVAVAACAVCDAATQRIPTRLAGYGAAATAPLLAAAAGLTGAWPSLLLAAAAAVVAALILGACWRFLGLGFGDVRLGALGGLGLGHTRPAALAAAVAVLAVVTAAQAAVTYYRTRDRRAHFPLGPALAAAFLTAAVT